jgi:hypothetical protein
MTSAPRTGFPLRTARPRGRWGEPWLAAVAGAFTLAQLVLVRPDLGLGWDETVYVSQVSGHVPAAFFSAPRARGISLLVSSLLVSPIASWSVAVLAQPGDRPPAYARTWSMERAGALHAYARPVR